MSRLQSQKAEDQLKALLFDQPTAEDLGARSVDAAVEALSRVLSPRGTPMWDLNESKEMNIARITERVILASCKKVATCKIAIGTGPSLKMFLGVPLRNDEKREIHVK